MKTKVINLDMPHFDSSVPRNFHYLTASFLLLLLPGEYLLHLLTGGFLSNEEPFSVFEDDPFRSKKKMRRRKRRRRRKKEEQKE